MIRLLAAFLIAFGLTAAALALLAVLLGGLLGWPGNAWLAAGVGALGAYPVYRLIWRRR